MLVDDSFFCVALGMMNDLFISILFVSCHYRGDILRFAIDMPRAF